MRLFLAWEKRRMEEKRAGAILRRKNGRPWGLIPPFRVFPFRQKSRFRL
jgi:hypothetical protein